jgi:hypothetical protein
LRAQSSVVKSVRLTAELNNYLNEEALRSGITISSLVSQIVASHRDRYRHIDKLRSVSMLPSTLASILSLVDEAELVKVAPSIASGVCVFNTHVLGGRKTPEGLAWCITKLMPALNWYNCFHTNDVYLIDHGIGGKWSIFLMSFLSSLIESETGSKPKIRREGEMIILDAVNKDCKNGKNGLLLDRKNGTTQFHSLNI